MNSAISTLGRSGLRASSPAAIAAAPTGASHAVTVSLLDDLPYGVIVFDRALRVTLTNRRARAMIDYGGCMSLSDERLRFLDAETTHRFMSAVAQVTSAEDSLRTAHAVAFRISRNPGASDYLASLKRIGAADPSVERASTCCVHLFDFQARRSISPRLLRQMHGLTVTEALVAAQLYRGLTLNEAADALCISVHTIKTHLKRIFEKCAVRSQAELLCLMERGPKSD
jgi:DNA-binding CsgD family transcriptional regulator